MITTAQKLSKRTKMLYGLGDFASQFIWTFTSSYLTIYYTDIVGIGPAIVSALMFGARIWDAINDPMFGAIAERTQSKHGRFRPYILYGTPFLALFFVLTFTAPFSGAGNTANIIWATVTYIILGMLYTVVNLSYGSLSSVISYDSQDRVELNSWRMIGANVGQLVLNAVAMPIILFFSANSSADSTVVPQSRGYLITVLMFASMAVILFFVVFKNTKEVVKPVSGEVKISIKDSLKAVVKNKPLVCMFLTMIFYIIGISIHSGLLLYYINYVVGRMDLAAVLMTVPSICTIIVMYLNKGIIDRVGKKKMLIISYVGLALTTVLLGFTDASNIMMIILLQCLWGAFKFASPILMGSIPECIDYAEDKFGIRSDGISYSFVSLATKIGPAIGPSIGLLALGSGYVANTAQSVETIKNINFAVNYLPVVFLIIAIIPAVIYPLNNSKNDEIKARLEAKMNNK